MCTTIRKNTAPIVSRYEHGERVCSMYERVALQSSIEVVNLQVLARLCTCGRAKKACHDCMFTCKRDACAHLKYLMHDCCDMHATFMFQHAAQWRPMHLQRGAFMRRCECLHQSIMLVSLSHMPAKTVLWCLRWSARFVWMVSCVAVALLSMRPDSRVFDVIAYRAFFAPLCGTKKAHWVRMSRTAERG